MLEKSHGAIGCAHCSALVEKVRSCPICGRPICKACSEDNCNEEHAKTYRLGRTKRILDCTSDGQFFLVSDFAGLRIVKLDSSSGFSSFIYLGRPLSYIGRSLAQTLMLTENHYVLYLRKDNNAIFSNLSFGYIETGTVIPYIHAEEISFLSKDGRVNFRAPAGLDTLQSYKKSEHGCFSAIRSANEKIWLIEGDRFERDNVISIDTRDLIKDYALSENANRAAIIGYYKLYLYALDTCERLSTINLNDSVCNWAVMNRSHLLFHKEDEGLHYLNLDDNLYTFKDIVVVHDWNRIGDCDVIVMHPSLPVVVVAKGRYLYVLSIDGQSRAKPISDIEQSVKMKSAIDWMRFSGDGESLITVRRNKLTIWPFRNGRIVDRHANYIDGD